MIYIYHPNIYIYIFYYKVYVTRICDTVFCIPRKESQKQSNFVYFQKNGSCITPMGGYNLYKWAYAVLNLIPSWWILTILDKCPSHGATGFQHVPPFPLRAAWHTVASSGSSRAPHGQIGPLCEALRLPLGDSGCCSLGLGQVISFYFGLSKSTQS